MAMPRRKSYNNVKSAGPYAKMTLDEVGEVLGVTRERVRQIEKSALLKLRIHLERNGMHAEDFLDVREREEGRRGT